MNPLRPLLALCLLASAITAAELRVKWGPSPTPNVRYRLYIGNSPGLSNVQTNDVGAALECTITNLPPRYTYYFTATCIDEGGQESERTPEVSYTIPMRPLPPGEITVIWTARIDGRLEIRSVGFTDWPPTNSPPADK